MIRKIVTYIGLALLIALFGAYFYFASLLKVKGKENDLCTSVRVTIVDSTLNRFVSISEVEDLITQSNLPSIGKPIKEVNPYLLEELLKKRSAIKESDVAIDRDGVLHIEITQRRPLLRIESSNGGFYVDENCYVFPLVNTFTSYVPIVTGDIPLSLNSNLRGKLNEKEEEWLSLMLKIGEYIEKDPLWRAQIQQIDIQNNGDIVLYTRVGDQTIVLGNGENFKENFHKLELFYRNIVPLKGWNRYSTINLKYLDQVVCTVKEKNNK